MFKREGIDMDWVLYSDYDAMIDDFVDGKIKRPLDEPCQVIAMRDVDVNFTTCFITRSASDILTVEDLKGKTSLSPADLRLNQVCWPTTF